MNRIFAHNNEQAEPLHIFDKSDCSRITEFCEVRGVSAQLIINAVRLGSWAEVEKLALETVPDAQATDKLDGLIIKGYETKFGTTNTNGERYDKDCLDDFIQRYYVKNKLNIPVTIQHRDDLAHIAGRVLLVEVNTVGFYFVCYVPRSYRYYTDVVSMIREGVLQGLSKEGWASWEDMEPTYRKNGDFDFITIKKFDLTAMSIVTTPANAIPFEKVQQIKNAVQFHKQQTPDQDTAEADPLRKMFNQ